MSHAIVTRLMKQLLLSANGIWRVRCDLIHTKMKDDCLIEDRRVLEVDLKRLWKKGRRMIFGENRFLVEGSFKSLLSKPKGYKTAWYREMAILLEESNGLDQHDQKQRSGKRRRTIAEDIEERNKEYLEQHC